MPTWLPKSPGPTRRSSRSRKMSSWVAPAARCSKCSLLKARRSPPCNSDCRTTSSITATRRNCSPSRGSMRRGSKLRSARASRLRLRAGRKWPNERGRMNTRDHSAASVEMWNAGMPDVQRSQDRRELRIDRVGVKDLRYPLRWRLADGSEQNGVANFSLYVALAATEKGTHMSRFIELLEHVLAAGRPALELAGLPRLHADMLERLHADSGRIEIGFTLFLKKAAPVS